MEAVTETPEQETKAPAKKTAAKKTAARKPETKDDRPGTTINAEGWVTGGSMYVDWLEPGDLIAHHVPGFMPVLYRYERHMLRSEYGQTFALGLIPKPWRLIWRNPGSGKKKDDD